MTKDATNCNIMTQQNIATARGRFNCTVTSVVTDNARNTEKMRDALKEEDPIRLSILII